MWNKIIHPCQKILKQNNDDTWKNVASLNFSLNNIREASVVFLRSTPRKRLPVFETTWQNTLLIPSDSFCQNWQYGFFSENLLTKKAISSRCCHRVFLLFPQRPKMLVSVQYFKQPRFYNASFPLVGVISDPCLYRVTHASQNGVQMCSKTLIFKNTMSPVIAHYSSKVN